MSLSTLKSAIRRFLERFFRSEPPRPGHFVEGRRLSWRGWLTVAPWIWPTRDYLLYEPRGYGGWRRRVLIVLIHGCRQSPEDFAAGTRITALADERGWLVLLPRQSAKANPWSCWNWFDKSTSSGRGEAAIVAAQIRAVRRTHRVHRRRVFVAGMSAGGCLAAVIGVRYPGLVEGVFVHSGIACGAASGPMVATRVMKDGADSPVERLAEEARAAAPKNALPISLLAVHGGNDHVVGNINAVQLVRQYLVLNGWLAATDDRSAELPPSGQETTRTLADGRSESTVEYGAGSTAKVSLVRVAQLGHAWSGGDEAFPYNDSHLPDATALLGAFVAEHVG